MHRPCSMQELSDQPLDMTLKKRSYKFISLATPNRILKYLLRKVKSHQFRVDLLTQLKCGKPLCTSSLDIGGIACQNLAVARTLGQVQTKYLHVTSSGSRT
jgi:hypothetical protein